MEESSAGERSAVMLLIEEPVEATASIPGGLYMYISQRHSCQDEPVEANAPIIGGLHMRISHHGIHIKTGSQEHLVLAI